MLLERRNLLNICSNLQVNDIDIEDIECIDDLDCDED